MDAIHTQNHGPLILSSTYWGSELERAGKLFVSVNGGAIRILMPASARSMIEDMRGSQYAVLSRGPWPAMKLPEAVEIMFEDGSDNPFALHLSPESFGLLPAEPPQGREWIVSIWDLKKGRPHKSLERICHWRRVPEIPYLKAWQINR
jgi:hypothetical protein